MKIFNTAPAFKTALLFSIGIILGKYFPFPYYLIALLLVFLVFLLFVMKGLKPALNSFILFLIIIFFGFFKQNFDVSLFENKSINNFNKNLSNIFIVGIINDLPEYTNNRTRLTVKVTEIVSKDDTLSVSGNVLTIIKQTKVLNSKDTIPQFEAGDKIIMFGSLRDAPEETNPGDFNYKNYLALNDINKIFKVDFYNDVEVVSRNNLNFIQQYIIFPARKYAISNITTLIGGEESAFLNGLVTGYRGDFSKELKEDFVKAGVMHLIAVSGLNVAYIIIFLSITFSLLRIPLNIKLFLFIFALLFYSFFTGASSSIVRASIMGSVLIFNYRVQRKINFYNVIGISALLILIYDSRQLFDAGFILSYSAVLSIVVIFTKVNSIFGNKIDYWIKDWRKLLYYGYVTLITTISAQIGVLPITINYFGKVSLIGILTNIIAIPASNLSLALGFIQIIFGTFSFYLSSVIAEVNWFLLHLQIIFIKWAANLPYSYFEVFGFSFWMVLIFYTLLLIFLNTNKSNYKFTVVSVFLIIIIYLIFINIRSNSMNITFLSIGNADCTHIETPDGSNILIDAGIENQFINSTSTRVVPYLKRKNVTKLDLLIISSKINKNQKALQSILNNFQVNKLILIDRNEIFGKLENSIIESKTTVEEMRYINNIKGYGGLNLLFLKNNSDFEDALIKLLYNNNSFLFTGKTEIQQEKYFVEKYSDALKSDVIKIAKFGSDKSSSEEFLTSVNPSIAVISTSGIIEKNLPSLNVLKRLESLKSYVFRTDEHGAIVIESDGNKIELK